MKSEREREHKKQLLNDALEAVEHVMEHHRPSRTPRVTLLEGDRVGSLALLAVISYSLQMGGNRDSESMVSRAKRELVDIGRNVVQSLPMGECEVLYGRAGYLQAIAFVRSETNDQKFAQELVRDIVKDVLEEGTRMAKRSGVDLQYLWGWYEKLYLGAAHGIVGILATLLYFKEEVQIFDGALEHIRDMIWKLDEMCFESGNLKPSITDPEVSDRLVHFCHGASGHILLLVKAYEVFEDVQFLERAETIARSVMCRRGLLRKGVGLCQ